MPNDANRQLYEELGALARYIETAIHKLAEAGGPVLATTRQLPQATTHLTDLCRLTEEGTHEVMRLAESVQDNHARVVKLLLELAAAFGEGADTLPAARRLDEAARTLAQDDKRLMDLMTALSFQDLVAQRVQKVIDLLGDVQRKLLELIVVFGPIANRMDPGRNGKADDLLKQLDASKSTAIKQALVDDILRQFGFH
jgi:chemotaxis protein CheZ